MNLGEWIKSFFSRIIRAFRAFLDEALPLATQYIMGQLKDIALMAVTELASTDLNNEQKRKAAFERIKKYAIENRIENAQDSIINTLIELAYQKFKETME